MSNHTLTPYFPNNPEDYAPWVAERGLVAPYGECQCGCGEAAKIALENQPKRGWRKGEPLPFVVGHHKRNVLAVDFWRYVSAGASDDCWEWQGACSDNGYGSISIRGKQMGAHRASYELHFGEIREGYFVLHKCDNPPCVNPAHLFLGSHTDNMRDKVGKGRHPHGSTHHHARWTEDDIRLMRTLYSSGVSQHEIARRFGTHQSCIKNIVNRKAWTHVE